MKLSTYNIISGTFEIRLRSAQVEVSFVFFMLQPLNQQLGNSLITTMKMFVYFFRLMFCRPTMK